MSYATTATETAPVTAAVTTRRAPSLAAQLSAEALGTFLLCFAGLGTALWAGGTAAGTVPVGVGFGLGLLAALVAFGYVSGGHFNPAVSLAAAITGRIGWLRALYYVIAQVAAAVFAGLILFLSLRLFPALTAAGAKQTPQTLMSALANGFGAHSPSTMPLAGVLLIEVVGTAIFVAVILGSSRRAANTVLAPLAIAATLAAVITVALPLSNASINPARSTAVVFFAEPWALGQLWLFWLAPLLGGALAGLVHRAFASPETGETDDGVATVNGDGSASALAVPPLAVAGSRRAGAGMHGAETHPEAVTNVADAGTDSTDGVTNAEDATIADDATNAVAADPAGATSAVGRSAAESGTAAARPAGAPAEVPGPAVSDAQDFFDNPAKE